MKITIKDLQDKFKYGYELNEPSRVEARNMWNDYHNRQYTDLQEGTLEVRGQPKETFNVIKLFSRMLLGYFSNVVNSVQALPVQQQDTDVALLVNDVLESIFTSSTFTGEGDKIKLSCLISGLMISYTEIVDTGKKDEFGRPIRIVEHSHVPDDEITLDPASTKDDYSDADWIHRHKWMLGTKVNQTFGAGTTDKLDAHYNHLEQEDTEFLAIYRDEFVGKYKVYDNYLIVHTIMVDEDGKSWSIFWSGETILDAQEVSHKEVKSPYRVHKLHTSNQVENYGLFREVAETQKAINQALLKFQLLANTQKAFVQEGAVDNIDDFTAAFNRVSGVIPVLDLSGIRIENLAREALEQYSIIDKAFDRLQRILGINDSFLGNAFASDSGRKVKLQQNASVMSLRYLTGRIEQFYRLLGEDTVQYIKQYYTASQALRIADNVVGQRWIELNKPMTVWSGEFDEQNQPIMEMVFEEVIDPETGEPMINDEGDVVLAPIPEKGTEISVADVDVNITSVAYNDEDERNQLMMENTLSGNIGQLLAQVNPAGYFKAAAMSVKSIQTRHSPEISKILDETAEMLGGNQEASQHASESAGSSPDASSQKSSGLKLPQNTNE